MKVCVILMITTITVVCCSETKSENTKDKEITDENSKYTEKIDLFVETPLKTTYFHNFHDFVFNAVRYFRTEIYHLKKNQEKIRDECTVNAGQFKSEIDQLKAEKEVFKADFNELRKIVQSNDINRISQISELASKMQNTLDHHSRLINENNENLASLNEVVANIGNNEQIKDDLFNLQNTVNNNNIDLTNSLNQLKTDIEHVNGNLQNNIQTQTATNNQISSEITDLKKLFDENTISQSNTDKDLYEKLISLGNTVKHNADAQAAINNDVNTYMSNTRIRVETLESLYESENS